MGCHENINVLSPLFTSTLVLEIRRVSEILCSFLFSVQVNDAESTVGIEFTPTIPHCSMATLIGLSIKVKLLRSLPDRFKVCLPMEFFF